VSAWPLDIGWVDLALLAVLALSVAVGLWRGLVFEVLSLLGWVAAFIAAQAFAPMAAPLVPLGAPGSAANQAVSLIIVFVLALFAWALASRLIRLLIHATPLQPVDRVLGGVFGLARGAVLLVVVTMVVLMTPARASSAWQHSQGAAWLGTLLMGLEPLLPEALSRHLPA
jgi:membrane protein required for colicin V production